jgi:hypothetical protein
LWNLKICTARWRRREPRPRGRVAVTPPIALCMIWLPPILRTLDAKHPQLETSIHTIDTIVDLPRSDYDHAVRATYTERPAMPTPTISCPWTWWRRPRSRQRVRSPQPVRDRHPSAATRALVEFLYARAMPRPESRPPRCSTWSISI